jgi:hypothetical protein
VVRVLEAVHLLLAVQTFVVVVGVDPRWLAKSLREWHPSPGEPSHAEIKPADYLDKIFQLSYQVPAMTTAHGAALLRRLAEDGRIPDSGVPTATARPEGTGNGEPAAAAPDGARPADTRPDSLVLAAATFQPSEIESIGLIAPLVSQSPRLLKRFLNTYRIVRARALMDSALGPLIESGGTDAHLRQLQVVTALAVGLPHLLPALDTDGGADLRTWATAQIEVADRPSTREALSRFLDGCGSLADLPIAELRIWVDVVHRFTAQADIKR